MIISICAIRTGFRGFLITATKELSTTKGTKDTKLKELLYCYINVFFVNFASFVVQIFSAENGLLIWRQPGGNRTRQRPGPDH